MSDLTQGFLPMRKKSVIAALVPLALLGPFYLWVATISMFVGMPPTVEHLPPWLERWFFVGVPLVFLIPPGGFIALLIGIALLPFHHVRGPATAFLLSSGAVCLFLM